MRLSVTKLAVLVVFIVFTSVVSSIASAQTGGGRPAPDNTTPGKITVQLSGTATANSDTDLRLEPAVLENGIVEVGKLKQQTIQIVHSGAEGSDPIQINDAVLTGSGANDYETSFSGFAILYPGDRIPVAIALKPTSPGDKSAVLRLSVEGLTSPLAMLLKGESRYSLVSALLASKTSLDFGDSDVATAKTQLVTLINDGEPSAPGINVTGFTFSGQTPAAFESNFQPQFLQPGQAMNVAVTIKSSSAGQKKADISVLHTGINDALQLTVQGIKVADGAITPRFVQSTVAGLTLNKGTSAQFGPDGKFYTTEMSGLIKIFDITRAGPTSYSATLDQTITSITQVPNHDDDGSPVNLGAKRLVTGLFVTGTAQAPVIYVASADPRTGAGPTGTDTGLDTNSGILHRLTKNGTFWAKQDLVRGLPRSEENHIPNGITVQGNKLYIVTGGHTNEGAPSNNFALIPEYALSAAVLEIDLAAIGNTTYDLPTLDDEDRPGVNDANDPFGGNNGKNQAKLIPSSPVKIYATGYRNAYDLITASNGKMYTFDNGSNPTWGAPPISNCSNEVIEGGTFIWDQLHVVTKGAYGGHPNPTRGNKNNTFNASNPQTPIEGPAMPVDCNFLAPGIGAGDGSLATKKGSTNGMVEYTASTFGGQMKGELIVASFNKDSPISRYKLTDDGLGVVSTEDVIAEGVVDGVEVTVAGGTGPSLLDVTATGDDGPFPGTIWIVPFAGSADVIVLEPNLNSGP